MYFRRKCGIGLYLGNLLTMRFLKIIIPFIAFTFSCKDNKAPQSVTKIESNYNENLNRIKENPYSSNYDTTLKKGFIISYFYDSQFQYLFYKKENNIIDTLSVCSIQLPYKNLGYIGADFDNTFVLVKSYGSSNPHYISLYEKEKMKNLLSTGSALIDVDTINQVLLYSKNDVPNEGDNMTLYDTKTMIQKDYHFPNEIFNESEKLNRINLVNITDTTFTIEYKFNDKTETKKRIYIR